MATDDDWDPFADPADSPCHDEILILVADKSSQEPLSDPEEGPPPEVLLGWEAEHGQASLKVQEPTLPARGKDGRRSLPERQLSSKEVVQWILDAVDEFETLFLPLQSISESAVRQQFKKYLLVVHPDKNPHADASSAFRKLFGAMETLCDKVQQDSLLQKAQGNADQPLNSQTAMGDLRPWWDYATVDEMERAFREQETRMQKMGFFRPGYEGEIRPQTPGADEDVDDDALLLAPNVWIKPLEANGIFSDAIFLDARDARDFATSHIEGAAPLSGETFNLHGRLPSMSVFRTILDQPRCTVVVYSDTGTKMSRCVNVAHALRTCGQLKPERVLRLHGGLNAWKRLGLPVVGDRRAFFAGQAMGDSLGKIG